jgi:hypothetical protein
MIRNVKYINSDLMGILNSIICIVHCFTTPLLIALGVGYLTSPFIKYALVFFSFITIYKALNKTKNRKIAALLWISFGCFLLSSLLEERYHSMEYMAYFSAGFIIIGHILNVKKSRNINPKNNENEK